MRLKVASAEIRETSGKRRKMFCIHVLMQKNRNKLQLHFEFEIARFKITCSGKLHRTAWENMESVNSGWQARNNKVEVLFHIRLMVNTRMLPCSLDYMLSSPLFVCFLRFTAITVFVSLNINSSEPPFSEETILYHLNFY